jgi:hypothetical protein
MRPLQFVVLVSLLNVACVAEAPAPKVPPPPPVVAVVDTGLQPVLVAPTVAAEDVLDDSVFVSNNGDELVVFVEKLIAPRSLPDNARESIRVPAAHGTASDTRTDLSNNYVVFSKRRETDCRVMVMKKSADGKVIPAVSWLAKAIDFPGASKEARVTWYREMGRRLATAGRASGIATFDNGNGMGIVLEMKPLPDSGDVEVWAQTRFFKKGEYQPAAWGPVLAGASQVTTNRVDKHQGVTAFDLLKQLRAPGSTPGYRDPATHNLIAEPGVLPIQQIKAE